MSDTTRMLIAGGGLGLAGLFAILIAFSGPGKAATRPGWWVMGLAFLVALALRGGASLIQDGGTYDIFFAYQYVGHNLGSGGDVFVQPSLGLSNYPPIIYWWWAAADHLAGAGHPHLFAAIVRAPFWICDAAIAPILMVVIHGNWRLRAAWCYALCPIAIAVPTLHGQFDSLPVLSLLLAVAWLASRPRAAAWAISVGAAIKTWPIYFLPVLLSSLRRGRVAFTVRAAVVSLLAFAAYALVHPAHILAGVLGVIIYTPHRQGLGTSRFFPESWGSAIVPFTNALLLLLVVRIAYLCARRNNVNVADAVALSILLVLGLSASVSDQYLMWPFAILLFAGRLRMATVLALLLTPATVVIEVNSAGLQQVLPTWLMLSASIALWVTAFLLWRATLPGSSAEQRATRLPVGEAHSSAVSA